MKSEKLVKRVSRFAATYRVTNGNKFRLEDYDPDDTGDLGDTHKDEAREALAEGVRVLAELQEKLYAQDQWAVLLVFQAMDAAGKDSTIKHVMSGVNPQGCEVHPFKAPTPEELDHDFLWRCVKLLPGRGKIGIFNRSYYEEMLIVRVHPEFLENEKLPPELITKQIWKERFDDIVNFERHLARSGTLVLKFFLNVSKKEQKKRFLERLDKPEKNWKFSVSDVQERALWNDYHRAYEDLIRHTAKQHAPWFVVPADHKWFTHVVVASAIVEALSSLELEFPKLRKKERQELDVARALLLQGK